MIVDEQDYLQHYGILRKSGRYPWGSGADQSTRNKMFLDVIEELRGQGMSDAEIAKSFSTDEFKFTSTKLRELRTVAINEQRQANINQAQRLKDKGMSNVAIGQAMGINESSVRSLLAPGAQDKLDVLNATSNMLKAEIDGKTYIDVGRGVETQLGLTKTKLDAAITKLQEEGYQVRWVRVPQLTTGELTTVKVLAKPDSPFPKIHQIQQIQSRSENGGREYTAPDRPQQLSSKRLDVVYGDKGGAQKDGLIELRPGVEDLSMGKANYAQVRIAVDGSHYIKGMAVYNRDLPAGVDVRFNTNKKDTGNKLDALKEMERKKDNSGKDIGVDLDNPFGASIKAQRGKINIIYEEGDWDTWSKNLPSQMLSKQSSDLAKTQLNLTYENRRDEFAKINALTNPAVKKKLLQSFADQTDSAAVHLAAAAMPRQASRVLIPVRSVKDNEIYAPSFRNGERVSLVRFPHGGTFEIPELTVNNKNAEARRLLGSAAKDAVGINSKVAERLSGADFDGDYALVIPNNRKSVKSTPALDGLKGFDPRSSHPPYDGMRTIDGGTYNARTKKVDYGNKLPTARKQQEMGKITNLIADMTILGASNDEIARAVRHSMVVIDAEKHMLDFQDSAKRNGIVALKRKYQPTAKGNAGGASTLITRAGSPKYINQRTPRKASEGGPIDPATGRKVFTDTNKGYTTPDGKFIPKKMVVDRLADTDDAHTLVSAPTGTRIERIYADHSNRLKALANDARKEMVATKPPRHNKTAKKTYEKEVDSLVAKLNIAKRNAPLERQAQLVGNTIAEQKIAANPGMSNAEKTKIRNRALIEGRIRTGAGKERVVITPSEWAAIQAGAISNHTLTQILANADLDTVRTLATPKQQLKMTSTKMSRARAMLASGYTQAEVADQLGVSLTTLKTSLA